MKDIFTAEDAENAEDFDGIVISSRLCEKSLFSREISATNSVATALRNDKLLFA